MISCGSLSKRSIKSYTADVYYPCTENELINHSKAGQLGMFCWKTCKKKKFLSTKCKKWEYKFKNACTTEGLKSIRDGDFWLAPRGYIYPEI